MNLEDVDRELDSLGPVGTLASLPIERLGDLAAVDAVLASLGEGVAIPVAAPAARSSTSVATTTPAIAPRPPTPPKPSVSAKPAAPPAKPPSAPRPPAPKSAMPPPPPKSVMPRVPAPEPTRQVVAPEKPTDSSTRQVVAPSPSSPGSLSADDLFADLADDDVPSAASERPVEPTAETASETTNETSSPLAELFSDLDEEVAEVGNLFEEEPPSEERLSLELGDFDDLVPETGTTSALPSTPPPSTSVAPSAPSTPPRAPSVAPASAASPDDFDDFEEPVADSTSLFSAADVAAIRRASSVPAPMAAARPATPSTSSPLDELVLEDDFELLIDDDEAEDSTFVGKADDVEASGDEQGDEDPSDDDPSGKKGFFKKLFG